MTAAASSRPTVAHLDWARQCLALESAATPDGVVAALVYDRLRGAVAPLVGDAGVELLFVRSAKLAGGDLARMSEVSILVGAAELRTVLGARDPGVSRESATLFFATFLALLTTFIGDRLTTQILRRAWPALDPDRASTEGSK
jgi:hypothetical protein